MRWVSLPFLLIACSQAAPHPPRFEPTIMLYATGASPRFLLGDVDGDGFRDVVIAYGEPETDKGLALRRGNGSGFGESQRMLYGTVTFALFDVDADGRDDVIVDDGQNLGLLRSAIGPMEVLAQTRDPTIVQVDRNGVTTGNGSPTLTLHAWSSEARAIDVRPLDVRAALDFDHDGALDFVGIAHGHAAVRFAPSEGAMLLSRAQRVTASNGFVIGWTREMATLWKTNTISRVVIVPKDTIAIAANDQLTISATKNKLVISEPTREPIEGPWSDIRQLVLEDRNLYVADWGIQAIAVIRL